MIFAFSCRNESCMESLTNNVTINFYKDNTTKDSAIYNFYAYGIGKNDNLIYDSVLMKSSFNLPLNINSDTSRFELTLITITDTIHLPDSCCPRDSIIKTPLPDTIKIYKPTFKVKNIYDTIHETLIVSYSREIELVSHECGFSYIIKLDSVWSTKNIIDSIYLSNPTIERGIDAENVKIFL